MMKWLCLFALLVTLPLRAGSAEKFPVGFEVIQIAAAASDGKPLQVSLWYPAEASGSRPMTYSDYFLLSTTDHGQNPTRDDQAKAVAEYKQQVASNGVDLEAIDQWFAAPVAASANAKPREGRFPLILVAQGNSQSAADQAFLCESLASFGYVVATSPSPTRVKPIRTEEDVLPAARRQAAEMKATLLHLKNDRRIDSTRVGVVAHSFGARSALLFVEDVGAVKAMVSLDGGIANKTGKEWIDKASDFDRSRFHAALLHLYEDVDSFMIPDFDLLKSLKSSNRYLIKIENLHHYQFSSFGFASGLIPKLSENQDAIKTKCDAVFRYTLMFLNAWIQDDAKARKFIDSTPEANGFSKQDIGRFEIWKAEK